jgi:nucleoside-diphosphate-sugar epimerase
MDRLTHEALPARIEDEVALEDLMTTPSAALVRDLEAVDGDLMVLGVGGKMGPTLARLAKRATPERRVIGVARFSEPELEGRLQGFGIETIRADLMDRDALARLPDVANVVFMAGRKFGTSGSPELTWAMNVQLPAMVGERFASSRIVAFSTGNVYPFTAVGSQGADEATEAVPPPGEYANSCLGRERMFEHHSKRSGTPGRIIRLNYAIDLRYGVLADIATRVLTGTPVDLAMGQVNVIWQGDANAMALRSLRHCTTPTSPLNVTGPETVSVRWLAERFARRFERVPVLQGSEAPTALLNNAQAAFDLFGYPIVPLARMIDWVADWVLKGGATLNKATHYDVRDGRF